MKKQKIDDLNLGKRTIAKLQASKLKGGSPLCAPTSEVDGCKPTREF